MRIEHIADGDTILAIIARGDEWGKGLNFLTRNEDYQQVAIWGYDEGHKLLPHIHLHEPREILHTQEVLYIREGSIRADIYKENREFLKSVDLQAGDVIILLNGGHGYEILQNDTKVLEIKNGPYPGAEKDRERIQLDK